ncbi:hypothetical protein CCHL11_01235 [Colletotrichum chlorophyti]|uniref:SMODS and SLOG-associating 2TM effector domain-containing protein n=1 Tax=Colletotrichum chlorophyti TaxID=708187 RepID=A0A1Q8S7Z0_9PEZI|nr:hypothetical protein CCHL11_01235 [Colletotrichum chlorophyti]
MRGLPPLQLDGIEVGRSDKDVNHDAPGDVTQVSQSQPHIPMLKKQKRRRVRYRFLTPSEWAIVAHGIGGVNDTEGHVALHPTCWYYPPKGIPNGLYRDVIWHRTKYFYFYHGMSTIRWVGYILQIIFSAILTAIGSMSYQDGTPITVIAAANTVNAGILALLHNSGLPDRYRSDEAEFAEVEDHLKRVLDTGVVPEDMSVDQVLMHCFELYQEAKSTIAANIPATYTPSSVLQSGQRAPEPTKSGTPGQTTPDAGNSIIASRLSVAPSQVGELASQGK